MNTPTTPTTSKALPTLRAVSSILVAMLGITALLGDADSLLNSNGLLAFFWPMSLIVLACYWLRVYLNEHNYLSEHAGRADDSDVHFQAHVTGTGVYITPVCLTRT
jgi:hypothetical protein